MNITRPLRASTTDDADRHRLVWAVLPADRMTPVRAFERLRAAGHRAALLESVEGPERLARYSFVALDPDGSLRAQPRHAVLTDADGREEVLDLPPHEALREASRRRGRQGTGIAHPDLPSFRGGWLGYFTYEWASTLEPRVPRPGAAEGAPDAVFDIRGVVVRGLATWDMMRRTRSHMSGQSLAGTLCKAAAGALAGGHAAFAMLPDFDEF